VSPVTMTWHSWVKSSLAISASWISWAEVIEPPEAPLDEEPAALMVKALGNPIYVEATLA